MATIVLLTRDARVRARMHGALGRRHRVLDLSRWAALPGTLLRRSAHVVVYSAGEDDTASVGHIRWIRRAHPDLAVLVYVDLLGRPRDAWHLGRQGADGIVAAGVDDGRFDLRSAVDRVLSRAVARQVDRRLRGRVDPLLLRCATRATEGATRKIRARHLAEAEGVGVRSLGRQLRERRLPPPGRILRWGGLFHAAAALDRNDATVERIALDLGYSTGTALGRALRRDVGHPPSTLKERGSLACSIDAFVARNGSGGPGLVIR